MNVLKIVLLIIGSIAAFGLCAGGFGYLVSKFSDGRKKEGKDQLNDENALVIYLRNENAGYKTIVNDQTIQIAELRADNGVLNKKVEELDAIVKGKSPDDLKFRMTMLKFIEDQSQYQIQSAGIMNQIMDKLKTLNESHDEVKELIKQPTSIHIEGEVKSSQK